jgi:acyl carrier protein
LTEDEVMGLDAVEFAMELEDHFGVRLKDDVFWHARTVGELAAVISTGIMAAGGACVTARVFYQVRRWLEGPGRAGKRGAAVLHVKGRVRPSTGLSEVLPRGRDRRRMWRAMARDLGKGNGAAPGVGGLVVPELTWSLGVKRWLGALSGLLCVGWLVGSVMLFVVASWWIASIATFVVALALIVGFLMLDRQFQYELPEGVVTAGDLARRMVPGVVIDSEADRAGIEQRVLLTVREVASRQFGLPLEKVTAQSRFVEDLGMG